LYTCFLGKPVKAQDKSENHRKPAALAIQTRRVVKPAAKLMTVFCAGKQVLNNSNSPKLVQFRQNGLLPNHLRGHGRLRLLNLGNAKRQQPVDKRLDIHRVFCAELLDLALDEFLSNNRPAQIQCFSGHL